MESLKGYKTYIFAALIAITSAAKFLGFIDSDTYQTIMGLLGAGGVATLAAKGNRIEEKVENKF